MLTFLVLKMPCLLKLRTRHQAVTRQHDGVHSPTCSQQSCAFQQDLLLFLQVVCKSFSETSISRLALAVIDRILDSHLSPGHATITPLVEALRHSSCLALTIMLAAACDECLSSRLVYWV